MTLHTLAKREPQFAEWKYANGPDHAVHGP
jgi:hypothetical protein